MTGSAPSDDPLRDVYATGLLAILRGLRPQDAESVGGALVAAGFRALEVPLNRPGALDAIARLARACRGVASVGAGTVLQPDQPRAVAEAGGTFAVMPHGDGRVIDACRAAGLPCVPGVATVTEAFAALERGASALKLFPAQTLPPTIVRAWRAVLPDETRLIAVGGVGPGDVEPYFRAGADAVGVGSGLFAPGELAELPARAERWVRAAGAALAARA